MTRISAFGTYLPPWGTAAARVAGPDEDALTMAVAAGRAALLAAADSGAAPVRAVVLVTRELPLLVGGNSAALLAGLGLADDVAVVEQVGGAPEALTAVAESRPGTLVIGADLEPAGAAAALVATSGAEISGVGRVARSLPVFSRGQSGPLRNYDDPRLTRERGVGVALEHLALPGKPDVIAGVAAKQAAALCAGPAPVLPTTGASSALFALAALGGSAAPALAVAVEQASAAVVTLAGSAPVHRDERPAQPVPVLRENPGPDIGISLAAYERAFEAKLRWEAGRCDACGTLALPPRHRCLGCGSEAGWSLVALPRTGAVYTVVTVHVPVPGLPTPYSLAIVELDGVDVRALAKVTGTPAGTMQIGDRGSLVLRRVAVRSGVPDYGYALLPDPAPPEVAR